MSLDIEKQISPFIESQFPQFYREEGELFLTFVKAYYEWMEQEGQVLNYARKLPDIRDIDKTIDEFILNFKNKYLPNIQFNVATNKQLFIKNALEFYRAKGSERAVDLFFKLVYGLEARIYYPGDDLFKLSDNEWINQRYLEVIPNPKNLNFVGQQVFGSRSGASAFCDRLVRIKKDNQYIEVLYLSGVTTDFITGEQVETKNLPENITARIDGSLTTFEITTSSAGFEVGEQVYVSDGLGKKAKAVVTQTENYVGVVEFTLLEGGWGYTEFAEVVGSERVFRFDNLTIENTDYFYHTDPTRQFELIQQDLARVEVDTTNTQISDTYFNIPLNTQIYAYANNDPATNPTPIFESKLVGVNRDSGVLILNYTEENYLDANNDLTIDLFSNTITSFFTSDSANGDGGSANLEIIVETNTATPISDIKAQANVIAWGNTMTIEYSADNVTLQSGHILYQEEAVAKQRYAYVSVANTFSIASTGQTFANIVRTVGCIRTNEPLIDEQGNEISIVNVSNVFAGAVGWNGEIQTNPRFYDFANTYGANTKFHSSSGDSFSYTIPAVFQINTYTDVQSLENWYSSELLLNELDVPIVNATSGIIDFTNAIDYVNEGNDVEFANTDLNTALSVSSNSVNLGTVSLIVTTNPGREYSYAPFFIIKEPIVNHLERYDFYIRYALEDESKAFRNGEDIITLNGNPNAKGRIKFHNPTTGEMILTRLNVSARSANSADPTNAHLYTSDDFRIGDRIIGTNSNISADIAVVDELRMFPRTGYNAQVLSESFSGEGFAIGLDIINSGFGYFGRRRVAGALIEGEALTLISAESEDRSIQAYGYLGKQGISPGSHPNRKSFLSSDKYLQDNDYYQEYSYEVLTALPFDKYKQTLIEVLHVAGTKPFGSYVGTTESSLDITATSSTATYDIKQFPLFVNVNTFYSANVA